MEEALHIAFSWAPTSCSTPAPQISSQHHVSRRLAVYFRFDRYKQRYMEVYSCALTKSQDGGQGRSYAGVPIDVLYTILESNIA